MDEIDNIYLLINSTLKAMNEENIYDKFTLIVIDHHIREYVILINENELTMNKSDFYNLIKVILNNLKKENTIDKHTLEIFVKRFKRKKAYYG